MQNEIMMNDQKPQAVGYDRLLAEGFGVDDSVEGVFLIEAKSEKTFFNRKSKLKAVTGFSDGFFDSYEEDDEGGVWNLITTAWFENIDELKKAIKKNGKIQMVFFFRFIYSAEWRILICRWGLASLSLPLTPTAMKRCRLKRSNLSNYTKWN